MVSVRVKTGIKKDAPFSENLKAVRQAVENYGIMKVLERLEEMKGLFYWIKGDTEQIENIDNLIRQLEHDTFVLPRLMEEMEVSEFVASGDGSFKIERRTIRVVYNSFVEYLRDREELPKVIY